MYPLFQTPNQPARQGILPLHPPRPVGRWPACLPAEAQGSQLPGLPVPGSAQPPAHATLPTSAFGIELGSLQFPLQLTALLQTCLLKSSASLRSVQLRASAAGLGSWGGAERALGKRVEARGLGLCKRSGGKRGGGGNPWS